MPSSKMSLKLIKFSFLFSDRLYTSFAKLLFTTGPVEIGQLQTCQVVRISRILYEKLSKIREYDLCLKNAIFLVLVLFKKKKKRLQY